MFHKVDTFRLNNIVNIKDKDRRGTIDNQYQTFVSKCGHRYFMA